MEKFTSIAPILSSSNIEATKAFWLNLGWPLYMEMPGQYAILGDSKIDFHYTAVENISKGMVYIELKNVNELHAEYLAKGAAVSELEDRPYGMREFTINDPDGNVFLFATEISKLA